MRRTDFPQVAALALILVALLACGEQAPPPNAAPPSSGWLFDPQLVALDIATPHTRFGGSAGSMLPGDGWEPVEENPSGSGAIETFSWAVGEQASVWVERIVDTPMDFQAHCRPMTSRDETEPQTMTVWRQEKER